MPIYVTRSSMPDLEDYIKEIQPVFESHFLTNMGPVYQKLKLQLKEYLQVPSLSLFVNGHMALEVAIQALGLNHPGGEVITTPFTFVSTTHAIARNNLTPVFCDIKDSDFTIDEDKIEALITDKTVAIIPVHVYGHICNVERIQEIADRHNLKVIYDAAHAFGVTYKGKGIGSFGDASMFSFHATKVFNTIEGGAIAYKDPAYRLGLHSIKNFGISEPDDVGFIGENAKMDEFRAAMGICNLRRINECISARKKVFDRYQERLGNVPGIILSSPQKDVTQNYAYYPVLFEASEFGMDRNQVAQLLEENQIYPRKYFYPAVNEMACYKHLAQKDTTPVAHDISLKVLTLPMYEELGLDDVDRICDIILQ